AFNARVRHREFNPGDLVLRKVLHVTPDCRGKFSYKYDGPFVVKETSGGAVILSDMDGTENALPVQSGTLRGISSPTDTRLAHVAGRNLKPSRGPNKKEENHSTPAQNAKSSTRRCPSMISTPNRTIRLFQHLRDTTKHSPHFYSFSILLFSTGFGIAFYCFSRASAYILLLSTGLGLAFYCFPRASASHFTVFHGPRPGILLLSTGLGLAFYSFPRASASHFTVFHGLRPALYYFPRASAWHLTAFHGLRSSILLLSTGLGPALYCFPRVSACHLTAFHGLRPSTIPLSMGFGLAFYCFPRASAWHLTAFHGLQPSTLPLSTGFRLAIYRFPRASAWQSTAFHGLRPGILLLFTGFGPAIYCSPRASAWHFTAFHGLRPGNLLLSTDFGLAFYSFPRAWQFIASPKLQTCTYCFAGSDPITHCFITFTSQPCGYPVTGSGILHILPKYPTRRGELQ
ncbi:hypothetical protein CRG98_019184, partial [Punica granatum]